MGRKKAAAWSSAVEQRLAHIKEMTIDQISKLLWDSWDDFNAGKITAKESGVLTKAANKRLRAIRRELRTANQIHDKQRREARGLQSRARFPTGITKAIHSPFLGSRAL